MVKVSVIELRSPVLTLLGKQETGSPIISSLGMGVLSKPGATMETWKPGQNSLAGRNLV